MSSVVLAGRIEIAVEGIRFESPADDVGDGRITVVFVLQSPNPEPVGLKLSWVRRLLAPAC